MSDYGKLLRHKQAIASIKLQQYANTTVKPSVLQSISKQVRLNYPAIKVLAKRQNIKVIRNW